MNTTLSLLARNFVLTLIVFGVAVAVYRRMTRQSGFYPRFQGKCVAIGAVLGSSIPGILAGFDFIQHGDRVVTNQSTVGHGVSGFTMILGIIVGNIVGAILRQFISPPQCHCEDE
ncbi:hypothetical protein BH11PLA2_BH11PLA2_13010 [soil metagenome]